MAIFRNITPGMEQLDMGWMTITYDEQIRHMKAEGASLAEMTADATKKMWEIVAPGRKAKSQRQKEQPDYHPKNYPAPKGGVSVRDGFMWSACGCIYSTVGLLLANAGVENLSLVKCLVNFDKNNTDTKEMEGHVTALLRECEEYPNGALLQIGRQPHWCGLWPGALEKLDELNKIDLLDGVSRQPIFLSEDGRTITWDRPDEDPSAPDIDL